MRYLRDPILFLCLLTGAASTSLLGHQLYSPAQTEVEIPVEKISQEVREPATEAVKVIFPEKKPAPPVKERIWIVGPGESADSVDISSIINKINANDIIELQVGIHKLETVKLGHLKKLTIKGETKEAELQLSGQSHAFRNLDLTLQDLRLTVLESSIVHFNGLGSKVHFDNVNVAGMNMYLYVHDSVTFNITDSEFDGVEVSYRDHSKGEIKTSTFKRSSSLLSISNYAQVTASESSFYKFTLWAIELNDIIQFKGSKLSIHDGGTAINGNMTADYEITDSRFYSLKSVYSKECAMNCHNCIFSPSIERIKNEW